MFNYKMPRTDKDKDLNLPPPLQLQEKKMEEVRKGVTAEQRKPESPSLDGPQGAAKFVSSDFSSDDEANIDSEIQELEKSILETKDQLSASQKKIRFKEKKEKADRLKQQLEAARKKLKESREIGEKELSKNVQSEDQIKSIPKKGVQFQDNVINEIFS